MKIESEFTIHLSLLELKVLRLALGNMNGIAYGCHDGQKNWKELQQAGGGMYRELGCILGDDDD